MIKCLRIFIFFQTLIFVILLLSCNFDTLNYFIFSVISATNENLYRSNTVNVKKKKAIENTLCKYNKMHANQVPSMDKLNQKLHARYIQNNAIIFRSFFVFSLIGKYCQPTVEPVWNTKLKYTQCHVKSTHKYTCTRIYIISCFYIFINTCNVDGNSFFNFRFRLLLQHIYNFFSIPFSPIQLNPRRMLHFM